MGESGAGNRSHKTPSPVRTLKVGDRITVNGDLEIVAVEGRWVTVRATPASAPPPAAEMFPVKPDRILSEAFQDM